jgi:hypothetical protein
MSAWTIIRFAGSAVLWTVGLLGLLTRFSGVSWCCLYLAVLWDIFLTPHGVPDLSDSGMRRWLRGAGIRLVVVLLVVGLLVYFHPVVKAEMMERVIHNPAVVLPVWLLLLWSMHRRWHRLKGVAVV